MRISRWGEIGILCCLSIADNDDGKPVGAAEIAGHLHIGLQYIQQILHRLRKGGVISSTRGPNGGFRLVKAPTELNLREIIGASEGSTFQVICDTGPIYDNCAGMRDECGLHSVWRELAEAVNKVLESRTLADVKARHAKFSPAESCYVQFYSPSEKGKGSSSPAGEQEA